jgi:hypothetical protein
MERAARYYGKVSLLFEFTAEKDDHLCFRAAWVLIMDPKAREAFAGVLGAGRMLESRPGFRMWTDDYSGMFGILK